MYVKPNIQHFAIDCAY